MNIKAELRHAPIAPRKMRLVAGLIKGMVVEDAERELARLVRRAGGPVHKLLRSAVANAKHNFLVGDAVMTIKDIRVNPGPVSKRFRPRAFGRAAPIRRRTSHLVLMLETGKSAAAGRSRAGAPMVREATREDLREATDAGRGVLPESREAMRPQKPKVSGFIRRVFRRKVI